MSATATQSAATAAGEPPEQETVNSVRLRGRISGQPVPVELPSGDKLVSFRLVVPRPPLARKAPPERRVPTIDTIDCVARTTALRRKVLAGSDVDVEITGALRRRFYRGAGGLGSRYEVELTSLTKCPG